VTEVLAPAFRTNRARALDSVALLRAEGAAEVAAIRSFRAATYEHRSGLAIEDDIELEGRGYLFGLYRDEELLACGRVLPLPDRGAGLHQFDHKLVARHGMDTEVGRVAVASGGSPRLVLATLGLGAFWMTRHTPYRTFVAFCTPRLAGLYVRVGARDLGVEVVKRGTADPYRFVAGRFDVTADTVLGMLGIDSPSDRVRPPIALPGAA
jgi:hypothetical protein